MAEPFLSEIRIMAFDFAPRGWALCNGQKLPISQNQALFSLIGTTYGGDGRVTFALPDMRGRTPMHVGPGYTLGNQGGEQDHRLSIGELPCHTHVLNATSNMATTNIPDNTKVLAKPANSNLYGPASPPMETMHHSVVVESGGSEAHMNMQPFVTLNFCIALQGIFPSQN